MASKNQEQFQRNSTASLDVYLYDSQFGGVLTDADGDVTWKVYDPVGQEVTSGTGARFALGSYKAEFLVGTDWDLSNQWKIIWEAVVGGTAVSSEELFEVLPLGGAPAGPVTVDDDILDEVKSVLGHPIIDKVTLCNDDIIKYCIKPALRRYFVKFPVRFQEQYLINGELEIDWPGPNVFGITYCNVTDKEGEGGSNSSFWQLVKFQKMGAGRYRGGSYGTGYNFNFSRQASELQILANNTRQNRGTFRFYVNEKDRKLEAFSEYNSKLVVEWATITYDFADVKLSKQDDVIELAQAALMWNLANQAGLVNTNEEITIDSDTLNTKAEDLKTKILEKWDLEPSVILLRS